MSSLVKKVIDTAMLRADDYYNFGNAAIGGDGVLKGWHVTSKPQALISWIESGRDLKKDMFDDLGPGLYMSAVPHFWSGRDTGKWSFLKKLDKNSTNRLLEKMTGVINGQRETGYISESEKKFALESFRLLREGQYDSADALVEFSGQPYNIPFWKAEFLAPLGIEPGEKIGLVEIEAAGVFAELNYHPRESEIEKLVQDYDGAFTRSGFSTSPQCVIYRRAAVVKAVEADAAEFAMANPRRRK